MSAASLALWSGPHPALGGRRPDVRL